MNKSKALYKQLIILGVTLLIPFFAIAQNLNIPLNQSFNVELEYELLRSDDIIHSSFKPILARDSKNEDKVESLLVNGTNRSWVSKRLFYQHFITIDSANFKLTIDPIVNFEGGVDNEFDDRENPNLYKNTRGFVARLQLGDKVALESTFRENQTVLPYYLDQRIREQILTTKQGVAYGQGRVKTFKDVGYDFAMASAYLSVSPNERWNFQLGHGKHFVGNGHRSMLLSDLSFNAPYLKVNSNWLKGRLQYQNLYTLYQDLNRLSTVTVSEGLFERKQAATHFLEFMPNSKFSIGLFESTIFPSLDSSGNVSVGFNYWMPVIFLNTLVEGDSKKGNNKVGLNINYKLIKKIQLYGQVALQSGELNLQVGAQIFPHKNILLQTEYNRISAQSGANLFSHYLESTAHPIKIEASELIGIAQFKKDRWLTRVTVNAILNEKADVAFLDFRQSFVVNPSYNFTLHLGTQIRRADTHTPSTNSNPLIASNGFLLNSNFIYFGLSTNLQNIYFNY